MNLSDKKIKEVEGLFKEADGALLEQLIQQALLDSRAGVIKIGKKYAKYVENIRNLKEEWAQKTAFDHAFKEHDQVVVGIDEVGRGPLAGPVVACAIVLPETCELLGVKDSKKIAEEKREALYNEILEKALFVGIGIVEAQEIDELNILQATFKAMRMALDKIKVKDRVVLVDGDKIIPSVEDVQYAVIQGDNKSGAIAAASIVAKVTRDRMMKEYAKVYPQYDWESNKGYGSHTHYEGIRAHGITPLHRRTFLKNEGF